MALSADEQKILDELTAKAAEPDADSAYEVEIFSGEKGARIPISEARDWLRENFGIGAAPAAADAGGDGGQGQGKAPKKTAAAEPARMSYFGKKTAGTQGTH
jgi:hypothetical protein